MNARDISVVIPTHNRVDLLCRALRSVRAQTDPPGEIIVVDDGSDDGTSERLGHDFPHILCVQQPNRGVSAARNRGIQEATGEWIALLDSDDEWLPEKLAHQLQALQARPEHRICHTEEIWVRNGVVVSVPSRYRKSGGDIFEECLRQCAICPSSVLIHRAVLDHVGMFDETLTVCEDYDLWLRICCRHPVLLVPQPLVRKYGGHDDQLSRRYWGMDRFRIQAMENLLAVAPLTPGQRAATLAALRQKISIYLAGVRKRGRKEELEAWEAKLRGLGAPEK